MKVASKVIVVTGGANGIGRETVLALLSRGAHVVAIDLNHEGLEETKRLAKENAEHLSIHTVNVSRVEEVEALPEKIIKRFKHVDGIMNIAGIIQPFVRVNALDYERIKRVMDVNFYGTLYMVKSFLPYLLKRPRAHIVNVSSMGGFLPVPGQSIYGASKAAVKLLTEGLYAELRETNVRVSVVFPGGVGTNITKNSDAESEKMKAMAKGQKSRKVLTPQDAANQIIDGMEKDKFRILVGKDAKMMDKMYRLNPRFATNLIAKKMKDLLD